MVVDFILVLETSSILVNNAVSQVMISDPTFREYLIKFVLLLFNLLAGAHKLGPLPIVLQH